MKQSIRMLVPVIPALLLTFGGLSVLTVCPGCATTGDPIPRIVVKAQNENQFLVDDRLVDLEQLPGALKRAGAGYESEIVVEIPADSSPASMRNVYPSLHSAGFQKVFLSHPREATATVKSATPVPVAPITPPARTLSPAGPQRRK